MDYGIDPSDDWSVLVLVNVLPDLTGDKNTDKARGHIPLGYVFVIQENKTDPRWKLPGGHKAPEDRDDPIETAKRELVGETYLDLDVHSFRYIGKESARGRQAHWRIYFTVDVRQSALQPMCEFHPGNEGERPQFFTVELFYALVSELQFIEAHYRKLVEFNAILPFGRDGRS